MALNNPLWLICHQTKPNNEYRTWFQWVIIKIRCNNDFKDLLLATLEVYLAVLQNWVCSYSITYPIIEPTSNRIPPDIGLGSIRKLYIGSTINHIKNYVTLLSFITLHCPKFFTPGMNNENFSLFIFDNIFPTYYKSLTACAGN